MRFAWLAVRDQIMVPVDGYRHIWRFFELLWPIMKDIGPEALLTMVVSLYFSFLIIFLSLSWSM